DDDLVEKEPAGGRRSAALPPAVLFMPPEADVEPAPRGRRSRRSPSAAPAEVPAASAEAVADSTEPATGEEADGARRGRRRRRGTAAEEPAEAVDVAAA